jgi:hypothetical protein
VRNHGAQLAGELSQAASAVGHAIALVTQAESDRPTLAWLYPVLVVAVGACGFVPVFACHRLDPRRRPREHPTLRDVS